MTSGGLHSPTLASSPSRQVTVLDVYDLAESINRDFEKIAKQYGKENIEEIVIKVICALETLEALAKNNDSENAQIADLQKAVEHLEQDRQQRINDKINMERDIVELEENYNKEISELCRVVQTLQSENRSIKRRLEALEESAEEARVADEFQTLEPGVVTVKEEEFQMMLDFRNTSMKQREQIRDLQRDIDNYAEDVENLRANIERLIRQNEELLRKNASLRRQGHALVRERADLQRRWQRTDETNFQLRRMLDDASRACADLEAEKKYEQQSTDASQQHFTLEELRDVIKEKTVLKARVLELEEQIDLYRGQSTSSINSNFTLDQEMENMSGISSPPDSSRQARSLHDELAFYIKPSSSAAVAVGVANTATQSALSRKRSPSREAEKPSTSSNTKNDRDKSISAELKTEEEGQRNAKNTEECLVYGPINREPDEKLNPIKYERKNSGVRKLFRFFREFNSGMSPRRASSNFDHFGGPNSVLTASSPH